MAGAEPSRRRRVGHDLPDGTAEDVIAALPGPDRPPVVLFSSIPNLAARASALGCADALAKGKQEWESRPDRVASAVIASAGGLTGAMTDAIRADNGAVVALHKFTLAVVEGPTPQLPLDQWLAQVERCAHTARTAVDVHAQALSELVARRTDDGPFGAKTSRPRCGHFWRCCRRTS